MLGAASPAREEGAALASKASWLLSLRNGAVRLYWFGQSCSLLGDRVYQVTLSWIAASLTDSGLEVSLVLVAASLPQAVMFLFGGALADRVSGRRVMIWADAGRAAIVAALGAVVLLGRAQLWMLYLSMALFGLLESLFFPASMACIADIAPPALRPPTNSLLAATRQAAMVIGPTLAAGMVVWRGLSTPVLFDAATFIVSVATLAMLRVAPRPAAAGGGREPMWRQILPGWRELARHRFLLGASVFTALGNVLAAGPWLVALPLLAKAQPGVGFSGLGLSYSAQAAGAVAAALIFGAGVHLRRAGLLVYAGVAAQGLGLLAVGLAPGLPTLMVAGAVLGVGSTVFNVVWQTSLQSLVPPELVGRVSGMGFAIGMSILPLGFLAVGQLIEVLGPVAAFLACGVALFSCAALMLLRPEVQKFEMRREEMSG